MQSVIRSLHARWVFRRRAGFLAGLLADLIPGNAKVLDIGCGNGVIGHLITQISPAVSIRGVEIMSRPDCLIECAMFDGKTLPVDDSSVDVCMFVERSSPYTGSRELVEGGRQGNEELCVNQGSPVRKPARRRGIEIHGLGREPPSRCLSPVQLPKPKPLGSTFLILRSSHRSLEEQFAIVPISI